MKYILFIFSIIPYYAYSQPTITWQECFGTSESDYFSDAILTSDNGFLVSATYNGFDGDAEGQDSLDVPATLLKFDANFNLIWQKNFGGATGTSVFGAIIEVENGFICGGNSKAYDGDFTENNGADDLIIVKTDLLGNKIWSHCYGGPLDDVFVGITPTSDEGFIVTGYSNGSGGDIPFHYGDPLSPDVIILKLNSDGEIQWLKVFGGTFIDAPLANPIEIKPGCIQIHIYSASDDFDLQDSGIEDVQKRWIIEVNDVGEIIKQSFMSAEADFYRSDGQLLLLDGNSTMVVGTGNAASTIYPAPEGHMLEEGAIAIFDSSLTMVEMKQWGGTGIDKFTRCKRDTDGNYYFLGYSSSDDFDLSANYNNGFNSDYWLMKTDSLYNLIWSKNFGGSAYDGELAGSYFEGDILLKDNNIYCFTKCVVPPVLPDYDIFCGHEPPNTFIPYTDAWLIAFDISTPISDCISEVTNAKLYPNPVNDELVISSINCKDDIRVNVFGIASGIFFENNYKCSTEVSIVTTTFPNGVYLIKVSSDNIPIISEIFIIQH